MQNLFNKGANVNKIVTKQYTLLQNRMTLRWNVPVGVFHSDFLRKQSKKSSILRFSRERDKHKINHFNVCTASKLRFLVVHVHTPSWKIKKRVEGFHVLHAPAEYFPSSKIMA